MKRPILLLFIHFQSILAYFIRGSIIVWLTSIFPRLDATQQVNLLLIQHKQSSWICTSKTKVGNAVIVPSYYKVSILWHAWTSIKGSFWQAALNPCSCSGRMQWGKLEKSPITYLMSCNSPNEKSCRFYQEITATTGLLLCKCLQLSQQECWLAGINCVVINLVSGRGGKCFVDSTVGVAASWGQNMNNLFLSFRSFGFCVCVAVLPLWPSLIGCQADNPMAMRLWPRNVLFFLLNKSSSPFLWKFSTKIF